MCDPAVGGLELLLDFEFISAFTCTYANVVGFFVLATVVYGAVSLSIYIRTGSVIIPFVLLLTTGGATMSQIGGPGQTIATIVLLVTGAGAMTYLYYAYSR